MRAGPPSAVYRLRKLVKRNRTAFAAAASIFIMLVAGVTVSTVQTIRALRGEARAQEAEDQSQQQLKMASRVAVGMASDERYQEGNVSAALAHLVKALSYAPDNARAQLATADLILRSVGMFPAMPEREIHLAHARIGAAAFSPDGRHLAIGTADSMLQIWEVATGIPVCDAINIPTNGRGGGVGVVSYTADGSRLMSFTIDGIRLWNAKDLRPLGPYITGMFPVRALSHDGRLVLVMADHMASIARIVETATGRPVGLPLEHKRRISAGEFHPDGKRVMTCSEADKTVRLWDAATGAAIGEPLQHVSPPRSANFTPDGRWIFTAMPGGSFLRWDLETRKAVSFGEPKGNATWNKIQFSPDGIRFATTSPPRTATPSAKYERAGQPNPKPFEWDVTVWETNTGKLLGRPMVHDGEVSTFLFNPDSKLLLTVAGSWHQRQNGVVRIWDVTTGRLLGSPLTMEKPVTGAAFSPDMQRFAVTSCGPLLDKPGFVHLWELGSGWPQGLVLHHEAEIPYDSFDAQRRRLVTGTTDGTVRVWDVASGKVLWQPLQLEGEPDSTFRKLPMAAWSRDGRQIATCLKRGTGTNVSQVWDAASGKAVGKPLEHENQVFFVSFTPDDKMLLTASGTFDHKVQQYENVSLRLWEVGSSRPVERLPWQETLGFDPVFSPDGRWLAVSPGNQVTQIDGGRLVRNTSKNVHLLPVPSHASNPGRVLPHDLSHNGRKVAFSPDSRHLLTLPGERPPQARIWDLASGKPVGEPLQHLDLIRPVVFSPDGTRVATGSTDGTARIWDVSTGSPLSPVLAHGGAVDALEFTADGRMLVTSSMALTRLWEVPGGEIICQHLKERPSASSNYQGVRLGHALTSGPWGSFAAGWDAIGVMESIAAMPTMTAFPREWLEVLEAIGGTVITAGGSVEQLPMDERLKRCGRWDELRDHLEDKPGSEAWIRLVDWCLKPRAQRSLSPSSPMRLEEHIKREMDWVAAHPGKQPSAQMQQDCYELQPGHPANRAYMASRPSLSPVAPPASAQTPTSGPPVSLAQLLEARKSVAADPSNLDAWLDLYTRLFQYGDARMAESDPEGAASSFLEAAAATRSVLLQKHGDEHWQKSPDDTKWHFRRTHTTVRLERASLALNQLTIKKRAAGDLDGAAKTCRQFNQVMEHITAEDPSNVGWRWGRTLGFASLSSIEEQRQNFSAAEASLVKALELCAPMLQSGEIPKPYEGLADNLRKRLETLRGKLPKPSPP